MTVLISSFTVIGIQQTGILSPDDLGNILLIISAIVLGCLSIIFFGMNRQERIFLFDTLRRKLPF